MVYIKRLLLYAIALIAGNFCGTWASQIAAETFKIKRATFMSHKLMIPTDISGGIELVVFALVVWLTVEMIRRTGILR